MNCWLYFPRSRRGHVGGFPFQIRRQRWGQMPKVTSCAVPGLGHGGPVPAVPGGQRGGRSPTCLPTPWLLSRRPVIARTLKDVTAFRRLLMASHGNWEPCDFHPPHPGSRNRKGLSCLPPRLAQPRVYPQEPGLRWEQLTVLGHVFPAGGGGKAVSQQSHSLLSMLSVAPRHAAPLRCRWSLTPGILGGRREPIALGAVTKTRCSMAARWGVQKWKGRGDGNWIDLNRLGNAL